jgi:3-phenylpropionate/trans-cinnamate dioxygenase ferredoxin reductase subunit
LLARVASPNVAGFFQNYHAERGVRIVCGASVVAIESDRHQWIKAVHLADGEAIACDAALIGVGAVACESIAADAGLPCTNGIEVNHQSRTSDPSVFAIGDVTSRPVQVYDDRMVRLESVPNALEQAKQAVHAILGLEPPAPEVPWFWSDQYDIKLQIAGLSFQCDDFLVRGSAANPPFAVYHMQAGRVLAVEAINSPQDFMIGKRLIASRKAVDRDKLVDSSISIKSLLI